MSNLIHTKIPPFSEDQPIDVGQLNLLNNNVQNLIQYWQHPMYFMSWYGGAVKPAAVLASYCEEKDFVSDLGSNLVRITPWGIDDTYNKASIKMWGAYKLESSAKTNLKFYVYFGGSRIITVDTSVSAANVPQWFVIPETYYTCNWQKPGDLWLSIAMTSDACTVILHEICIYGSPTI